MTGPFYAFPDVTRLIADTVAVLVGGIEHTGAETPENLDEMLPFIRVMRGPGNRDGLNDSASVDIDVFASTYVEAEALAEKVSQFLCGPPPPVPAIDRIDCSSTPQELPWGGYGRAAVAGTRHGPDPVRRFGASYTVVSRRRRMLT